MEILAILWFMASFSFLLLFTRSKLVNTLFNTSITYFTFHVHVDYLFRRWESTQRLDKNRHVLNFILSYAFPLILLNWIVCVLINHCPLELPFAVLIFVLTRLGRHLMITLSLYKCNFSNRLKQLHFVVSPTDPLGRTTAWWSWVLKSN